MISLSNRSWILTAGFLGCVACGGGDGGNGNGGGGEVVRLAVGMYDDATTHPLRFLRNVGAGWTQGETDLAASKLAFASRDVVWAYPDALLRSTDGGRTWQDMLGKAPHELRNGGCALHTMTFADARTGYMGLYSQTPEGVPIAGPFVWVTRDGGESWQPIADVEARPFHTSFALAVRSGVAELFRYGLLDDGSIVQVIDGGSFAPQRVSPRPTFISEGFDAVGERGYVAANVRMDDDVVRPAVFTSARPGGAWTAADVPHAGTRGLTTIDMCDVRVGVAGGIQYETPESPPSPLVFWTADGGSTWESSTIAGLPADFSFTDVLCVSPEEILLVAEHHAPDSVPQASELFVSRDGGRTFGVVAGAFEEPVLILDLATNAEFQ